MDKLNLSRPAALTICPVGHAAKAAQPLSPIDASYTAHRDAEQRRRATQEWLRQREALHGRRF